MLSGEMDCHQAGLATWPEPLEPDKRQQKYLGAFQLTFQELTMASRNPKYMIRKLFMLRHLQVVGS